ncbi:MAG TPA: hypothetical protein VNY70_09115 [Steroidobacteraceae bacterium]|nr:hypothetical protein [Steroidobacteraceae bacterium]
MRERPATGTMARAAALAALLALGACSHLHWPWHRTPPPPPSPVHELDIEGAAAPAQYWKRNTLLVDLSGASGEGHVVLKPTAGNPWPVRLAFRVRPGAFGALEVRGAAREVLPINSAGTGPVDLELPPGIYTARTTELTVSWGPAVSAAP